MAAATALAVAAVGSSLYGASQSADAARRAGQATDRASQEWQKQTEAMRKEALASYDQYVPGQQAAVDKAMQAQSVNLSRTQKLVDNIDPALIEAGKQTKQLLEGQSAPVLSNLQQQRQVQRQQMLDSLRQQIGPGAETSSMGQNMLMKFDSETSNIMSSAQQSYLSQVSGLALDGGRVTSGTLSAMSESLAKLGQQWGDIGATRAKILEGTMASSDRAYQSNVETAAGQAAGGYAQGALWQNVGSGLGQIAGVVAQSGGNANSASGGIESYGGGSNSYTMPQLGSQYSQQPSNYTLGSLGGSVSAPRAVGTYSAPKVPTIGGYSPE